MMERRFSTLEVVRNHAVSEYLKMSRASHLMIKQRLFMDFQMQIAFTQYIYKRVIGRNPSRKVSLSGNCITVSGECSDDSLHILPIWKHVSDPFVELSSEIGYAISEIVKGEKNNIYLAYPRLRGEARHVAVRSNMLEKSKKSYSLKLIPYVCDLTCLLNNKQGDTSQ